MSDSLCRHLADISRNIIKDKGWDSSWSDVVDEAADEITRLTERVGELEALTGVYDAEKYRAINEATRLRAALDRSLRAICFTVDYAGPDLFPAIDGWDWYEAGKEIAELIPDSDWVAQFNFRVKAARKALEEK